ncbi:uncharacterized protein F5Z01DRAFT_154732 [Emericellopsis atlantica]|uniref:Uncharacterized protein n=1 Tax=Emericellopsis atlantica TaxID=2614577 RepID=A0A9P8CN64_9HYPO|nr:uncharacterized protein F5Z01DRAFT_154732 [Emericellopsis atlantica]KAG9253168.1 hypothetical protein F5Z01DRAFT_154732 [Emericellopsis atlantica]
MYYSDDKVISFCPYAAFSYVTTRLFSLNLNLPNVRQSLSSPESQPTLSSHPTLSQIRRFETVAASAEKSQSPRINQRRAFNHNAYLFDSEEITTWYYLGEANPTDEGEDNGNGNRNSDNNTNNNNNSNGEGEGAGAGGNSDDSNSDEKDAQNFKTYTYNTYKHNGKRHITGGITYELMCNKGHEGGVLRNESPTDLNACARLCAHSPECYRRGLSHGHLETHGIRPSIQPLATSRRSRTSSSRP